MRAKLQVLNVVENGYDDKEKGFIKTGEQLSFHAVAKPQYEGDGLDEDNTFAKWSPSASFNINVANPTLFGQFKVGEKYYVDFTKAEQ
jgi:hypothetical protein